LAEIRAQKRIVCKTCFTFNATPAKVTLGVGFYSIYRELDCKFYRERFDVMKSLIQPDSGRFGCPGDPFVSLIYP
jgi:hypothetical protein